MNKNANRTEMEYSKLNDHIKRRVIFLLNEARLKSPRDQVITYVMRVLSNYAAVGMDGGSSKIKQLNLRVSETALNELNKSEKFNDWVKNTINEHQKPLQIMWNWMLNEAPSINEEMVWNEFIKHPMVTIHKTEDDHLNRLGLRSQEFSDDRYTQAGIVIQLLIETPELVWKQRRLRRN